MKTRVDVDRVKSTIFLAALLTLILGECSILPGTKRFRVEAEMGHNARPSEEGGESCCLRTAWRSDP